MKGRGEERRRESEDKGGGGGGGKDSRWKAEVKQGTLNVRRVKTFLITGSSVVVTL